MLRAALVYTDWSQLLQVWARAQHKVVSRSLYVCPGCKRQLSALRLQKSLDKNIFLALLAVPSPVFMLSSASYSYKTTTAWVLQKPHSRDAFLSLLPAPDQICNFNTSCRLHFWKDLVQNNQKETPSESAAVDLQTSNTQLSGTSATPVKDKSSDSGTSAGGGTTGSSAPEVDQKSHKVLTVKPRPRRSAPLDYLYTGNIYILPVRAMNEFLLKPSDLEGLAKYYRRSPYDFGPKITVYLRSDVEAVAKKVWGSLENVAKEKQKIARMERASKKYDIFHIRAILDENKTESSVGDEKPYASGEERASEEVNFWKLGSAKVVMSAVFVNGLNSILKFFAWIYTGSHSMFAEFVHSVADTMNQVILGVGLYHSIKKPDVVHPYGYSNLRNISSLISGVGIFFFGTGLSFYHGLQGLLHPEPLTSLSWGIGTLMGAFVSEGASLVIAINQVRKSSQAIGVPFWEYVRNGVDPNVSVVLLEDLAAVGGVTVAGVCMTLSQVTGSCIPDVMGSVIIGCILGGVASFIITTNSSALVGKSIPLHIRQKISQELEADRMIRSLHDIKATHMGGQIRFKAEVDFDGKEITRAYLYKQDLEKLLLEMKELQTADDVEAFMLRHGERIVDMLGEEVDRIERELKVE
ncbi:hypothetical protein C0Q70_06529 [Pomacea canaliculata]|uniref:Proton-coupled zinc antiporter SLC30A9, mitochondrial n=1 Tax=Pomacea canaliculata TaxID=400727 RepID=A0A2T7PPA3_POMCA|nr:hypothetical protein C0Q70_06529 [Pomacea canaliculata]